MTYDEANDAVGTSLEALFDAVDLVLHEEPCDFLEQLDLHASALNELARARDAHFKALDVWGEMYDAQKKSS